MGNDFLVVIADKIADTHSVLSNKNIFCGESIFDIFRYRLNKKYNIPKENIFDGEQNLQNEENTLVLYISRDCFDIGKKTFGIIMSSCRSGESTIFSSRKSGKVFAKFNGLQNASGNGGVPIPIDYQPIRNFKELREKNTKAQKKIIERLEDNGVQFISLNGVVVSPIVNIAAGCVIYPNTIIRGEASIGKDCVIGGGSIIDNAQLGENCVINSAQIYSSVLENNVKIGPFCHIRPNCVIKDNVKIGDFVEVKNSTLGEGTQASHLTYIGDSDVGERVNFGCGTVTVNYDGIKKSRCTIKDDAFIGCNANLIAPVTIGEKAFIAAGSTITAAVPDDTLAIARPRDMTLKENWSALREKVSKIGGSQ